eukprot:CAMPEP_0172607982 /NCGR_PEP_ID=MMETSP1068-20121228/28100_1 /TAXON_ID=35684 /ORGANISM="Pseudopedinella elastica, Strain CCMP716" /LENGTH=377 /DNA_ID=CAMNT_0013411123 /DNA_START=340 /DNA_END=1474 /DNA_ORIENTATION=-
MVTKRRTLLPFVLGTLALFFQRVGSNVVSVDGVDMSITYPVHGSTIVGTFSPFISIDLWHGALVETIREAPDEFFVCVALDTFLLGTCFRMAGGIKHMPLIDPLSSPGLREMHVIDVWIADAQMRSLFPENCTVAFSSAAPRALRMDGIFNMDRLPIALCQHYGQDQATPAAARLPVARGVLHIGANAAQEARAYAECVGGGGANVLFVECHPGLARACAEEARKYGQRCIEACVSDANDDGVSFFESSQENKASSSLRPFDAHLHIFPGISMASEPLRVRTRRTEDLIASLPAGLVPEMNVLHVDTQGTEFEVLRGMGKLLRAKFDVAVVEVSHVALYQGQWLGPDVDALMQAEASSAARTAAHASTATASLSAGV